MVYNPNFYFSISFSSFCGDNALGFAPALPQAPSCLKVLQCAPWYTKCFASCSLWHLLILDCF